MTSRHVYTTRRSRGRDSGLRFAFYSAKLATRAQALLCGTVLAPANHVLTVMLRTVGLAGDTGFQTYHRILNWTRWSAQAAASILLGLLVAAFASSDPLIVGLGGTVERRRGLKIAARSSRE